MELPETTPEATASFEIRDCALIAIATGENAETLPEFRSQILSIKPASLFYHFWGGLLHPRFEEREYNNDFAAWIRHSLHDLTLAERLALIDPTGFPNPEAMRQHIIECIEERLDESEYLQWYRALQPFEFIHSQIVVFNPHESVTKPEQLADVVPRISANSVFYHFIDARRRLTQHMDDFSLWLTGFDDRYADLCARLAAIDPYFGTLSELRQQLSDLFTGYFKKGAQ